MPTPTPPKPQPGSWADLPRAWSSIQSTAMTNSSALANPATMRIGSQATIPCVNGIAARQPTVTTNASRNVAVVRRARGATTPASAPARYPT